MANDPYQVLGVPSGASPGEVKRAYRRRVLGCHPDVVGEGREEEFRRIQEAYESLVHPTGADCYAAEPQGCRHSPPPWDCRGRRADALQFELELNGDEAVEGLRLSIPLTVDRPCARCGGSWPYRLLCSACGGWGTIRTRAAIRAEVPPGVSDGDLITTVGFSRQLGSVTLEFLIRIHEL